MWCLGVSGVWLEPNSFISAPATTAYSMGDTVHKRPAPEEQPEAKKLKLETGQDASTAKSSTLESSTPSNLNTNSGTSKPVLKRKSADETDKKTVSSDATPATPANSVSSSNNANETPTAPNTRLSSPQHVFGATSSFGNNASFSKSSVVMGKSSDNNSGKHVFGATSSFGTSIEDIKKRPNVFESLPSKLNDKSDTPKLTSSFGANSKFGNAFQESLNKKSFLEDASREKSEESENDRSETPKQFKQVELSPVDNKTGEEDERTIFTCTAKLFELDLTKISEGWKERGLGPLHLNQSISSPKQTRLVMRSQGLLRVILNMKISENTKLLKGLEASMSPGKFLRVNSVNAEGKPVQHLLKFGSEELRNGLYDDVKKLKGEKEKDKGDKDKEKKDATK